MHIMITVYSGLYLSRGPGILATEHCNIAEPHGNMCRGLEFRADATSLGSPEENGLTEMIKGNFPTWDTNLLPRGMVLMSELLVMLCPGEGKNILFPAADKKKSMALTPQTLIMAVAYSEGVEKGREVPAGMKIRPTGKIMDWNTDATAFGREDMEADDSRTRSMRM